MLIQEVEKRFPDGIPLLDPIEDMGIKEKGLKDIVKVAILLFNLHFQVM